MQVFSISSTFNAKLTEKNKRIFKNYLKNSVQTVYKKSSILVKNRQNVHYLKSANMGSTTIFIAFICLVILIGLFLFDWADNKYMETNYG